MGIYIVKGHLPFVVDLKRWVETNPKKNLRLAMRECQFRAVDFFQSVEANEAIPNIPKWAPKESGSIKGIYQIGKSQQLAESRCKTSEKG